MSTSRLEAFSDGVFAVAITLLVLQFVDPGAKNGELLSKLLGQWPQLATYGASFLTIGVIWVNHHTIFKGIREVDRTIQFINLVLLLLVVLVPYPTELLGHYLNSGQNGSVAAAFYAIVMTAMSMSFQVLVAYALRHPNLMRPEVKARSLRSVIPRFSVGLLTYAMAIGLAFVNATLVVALFAVTAIYYAFNQLPWMSADRE
jgi:uncharacterized membrane protein